MLDYILSRFVLFSFLFLLVGLLISYETALSHLFLSQAAKAVALDVLEKIRTVALNLATASEIKKIRLPPVIESGPVRSSYSIVLGCKKEGEKTVIGVAVRSPRGELLYAGKIDLFLSGKSIEVEYYRGEIPAGGVLLVEKESDPAKVVLHIKYCKDYSCSEAYVGGRCK